MTEPLPESDVTRILNRVEKGDPKAADELFPLVYGELRRLAAQKMAHEAAGHTLQATALVHEAWLRLGTGPEQQWANRLHFFSAAGEAMRRILVESARRKHRLKRGGNLERVDLEELEVPVPMPPDEMLALDAALDRLAAINPRAAQVVNLCFFVGLSQEDAARQLDVSVSTAERLWAFARAWLFNEIQKERQAEP